MITSLFIYILATIVNVVSMILPTWSVWPDEILEGVSFFGQRIAMLDFTIIDVSRMMQLFVFLVEFEVVLYTARLIIGIVNWFRGSGEIKI